jgi:hypothetical protein
MHLLGVPSALTGSPDAEVDRWAAHREPARHAEAAIATATAAAGGLDTDGAVAVRLNHPGYGRTLEDVSCDGIGNEAHVHTAGVATRTAGATEADVDRGV